MGKDSVAAMWRSSLVLIAASVAAASAVAAPPRTGETVLAGCRQGGCRWLQIVSVGEPQRFPQGVLRRIDVRRGASVHPDGALPSGPRGARIEWLSGVRTVYAFCSTRRPAFAFAEEDNSLLVHFLDPFDLAGYQYASAGLHMRVCHGLARVPSARVLRRLGYRPGTRSEQVENGTVAMLTRF